MDIAEALRIKIKDDVDNYARDVSSGMCRSFDEYRYLCGVIRGLAQAESHLSDLQKAAEDADDNE